MELLHVTAEGTMLSPGMMTFGVSVSASDGEAVRQLGARNFEVTWLSTGSFIPGLDVSLVGERAPGVYVVNTVPMGPGVVAYAEIFGIVVTVFAEDQDGSPVAAAKGRTIVAADRIYLDEGETTGRKLPDGSPT